MKLLIKEPRKEKIVFGCTIRSRQGEHFFFFFNWSHWCFAPKVRKYLAYKELPFKVLFDIGQCPLATQIQMLYLPPPTISLNRLLNQGLIRTFKAHYTQDSIKRIVSAMEGNSDKANILKVWKDFYLGRCHCVIDRTVKTVEPERINNFIHVTIIWCFQCHRVFDYIDMIIPFFI